jgi:hypothetical protein
MPDVAFVYPIQAVAGDAGSFVKEGGDHLLSFLGWDADRLRLQEYIHTPALIRTDCLRQLGGFAAHPSSDGKEDHDLWCSMANRGWRGQLVPQELVTVQP